MRVNAVWMFPRDVAAAPPWRGGARRPRGPRGCRDHQSARGVSVSAFLCWLSVDPAGGQPPLTQWSLLRGGGIGPVTHSPPPSPRNGGSLFKRPLAGTKSRHVDHPPSPLISKSPPPPPMMGAPPTQAITSHLLLCFEPFQYFILLSSPHYTSALWHSAWRVDFEDSC